MYVYKFGCTSKKTILARVEWIARKFKTKFNEVAVFDVNDIYAREKDFSNFFMSSYEYEAYGIELEWEDYVYNKSWETLASRKDISSELKQIMGGICNG
tara:strand:+ start:373 stop:669 length:297 start_codon:yes stop_codon:yes gene_type:complete